MAIRSSQFFTFDSKSSLDFNIWNVNVGTSGLLSEPFFSNRTINEVKIRGRDKPYYSGTTNDPLEFTVSFAINQEWTSDQIRAIARWLFTDYYKPLQFSDCMDRTYFAMFIGSSELLHTGASQGYINLNVRCSSPYTFSPTFLSPVFDLSSNPVGGTIISLDNRGDLETPIEIYIDKVNNGEVEVINLSNQGISSKFSYILSNPTVAPILSQVSNVGSTLPAVKYYVRYTWVGVSGETNVSPEVSFTIVLSGFNLVVTIPPLPSGASFGAFYIGTTSGSGTKQGTSTTTTFTLSSPLIVGANSPTSNSTGLLNNENVYVDSENELIISDQPNIYRYQNFSNNFLSLIYGVNSLQVFGSCLLRFRYSFVYLSG